MLPLRLIAEARFQDTIGFESLTVDQSQGLTRNIVLVGVVSKNSPRLNSMLKEMRHAVIFKISSYLLYDARWNVALSRGRIGTVIFSDVDSLMRGTKSTDPRRDGPLASAHVLF